MLRQFAIWGVFALSAVFLSCQVAQAAPPEGYPASVTFAFSGTAAAGGWSDLDHSWTLNWSDDTQYFATVPNVNGFQDGYVQLYNVGGGWHFDVNDTFGAGDSEDATWDQSGGHVSVPYWDQFTEGGGGGSFSVPDPSGAFAIFLLPAAVLLRRQRCRTLGRLCSPRWGSVGVSSSRSAAFIG